MVNLIKRILPRNFKNYILSKILNPPYLGDKFYCPVCDTKLSYFNPLYAIVLENLDKYGCIHNIFRSETISLTKYECPCCGASDRNRLYVVYLKKYFANLEKFKKYNFVDFAPNESLSKWIKKHPFLNYRTADLYVEGVDDVVDLMDIKAYKENSIDFFICSHVLEHVIDDIKAMSELHKILKTTGQAIIMVPISLDLEDIYEDANITKPEDRWKHFGQDDHYRLYSKKGFIQRLKSVGFKVKEYGVDYFGADTFEKMGINEKSILYIVEK